MEEIRTTWDVESPDWMDVDKLPINFGAWLPPIYLKWMACKVNSRAGRATKLQHQKRFKTQLKPWQEKAIRGFYASQSAKSTKINALESTKNLDMKQGNCWLCWLIILVVLKFYILFHQWERAYKLGSWCWADRQASSTQNMYRDTVGRLAIWRIAPQWTEQV